MDSRKAVTLAFFAVLLGMGYYSMNTAPIIEDERSNVVRQGGVEWNTNPNATLDRAQSQDKPVLVYYWTTWCTYCEKYDTNHYRNETVRAELDDYELLAVNLDQPGPGRSILQQHEASFPPQHRILTPDGETAVSIEGYVERDQFLRILRRGVASTEQPEEVSGPQSTNGSEAQ
jgi:thiol:disulfide interchange protein